MQHEETKHQLLWACSCWSTSRWSREDSGFFFPRSKRSHLRWIKDGGGGVDPISKADLAFDAGTSKRLSFPAECWLEYSRIHNKSNLFKSTLSLTQSYHQPQGRRNFPWPAKSPETSRVTSAISGRSTLSTARVAWISHRAARQSSERLRAPLARPASAMMSFQICSKSPVIWTGLSGSWCSWKVISFADAGLSLMHQKPSKRYQKTLPQNAMLNSEARFDQRQNLLRLVPDGADLRPQRGKIRLSGVIDDVIQAVSDPSLHLAASWLQGPLTCLVQRPGGPVNGEMVVLEGRGVAQCHWHSVLQLFF